MDKEYLMDQIDYVQARQEELDKLILNAQADGKGYKEAIESYNKWVDRYIVLTDALLHLDDIDIEQEKLNFEKEQLKVHKEIEFAKINADKDKQNLLQEIEQDKINNETERIRLDREKFANDVKVQKRGEIEQAIFETAGLAVKIGVPVAVILAVVGVSKLSYVKEAELELCNGRVYGGIKDLLALARLAV